MSRKLRIEYPGAMYHVMSRGDRREQDQEFKPVPRGWCVGSKQFRAAMLEYIAEQRRNWHYGAVLSESAEGYDSPRSRCSYLK